jgi:hypothetical protein
VQNKIILKKAEGEEISGNQVVDVHSETETEYWPNA